MFSVFVITANHCVLLCCVYFIEMADSRRALNMTVREKHLLLELIQQKYNIIENKETDKVSTAEKTSAWRVLAAEFCAASCIKRTAEQLKQVCQTSFKFNG